MPAETSGGFSGIRVAAENGHAEASYRLALAYQLGQGVEQDNQQAVRWYTQAAQAHHAKAQRSLGAMYEGGYGVKQNLQQAHAWYKRAAAQGLPDAQLRLGTLFFEGRGVKEPIGYRHSTGFVSQRKRATITRKWL